MSAKESLSAKTMRFDNNNIEFELSLFLLRYSRTLFELSTSRYFSNGIKKKKVNVCEGFLDN